MSAVFLRFAAKRWPVFDTISEHAFGIYFYHYVFVLWLQFALLGFAIPAIAKGLAVLAGALTLSWMASVLTNWILGSSQLLLGVRSHAAVRAFDRERRFPESKFPD
jgi:surface polysaccharide O-acyltransferase-like enzyme